MANIRIVTDSCAHFTNAALIAQHPVTVVPNRIRVGGKTYIEGVNLNAEEALRIMAREPAVPVVNSPSESEFAIIYNQLASDCDAIISIHPSRNLYRSYDNALAAARQAMGHCQIVVIDSQSLSVGQGMLVQMAAAAVETGMGLEDVVRRVRGAVERVYMMFYIETVGYLLQNRIMDSSHAIVGTMMSVKPFLTVENGCLVLTEKVRTRIQAVERLVEFVTEFTDIEDVVILENRSFATEYSRMVQDRLALEFSGRHFPHTLLGPSLAALLGTDVLGVVILEEEINSFTDDAV